MADNFTNCSSFSKVRAVEPLISSSRSLLVLLSVLMSVIDALTLFLNAVLIAAVCKSSIQSHNPSTPRQRTGNNTKVVKLLMTSMAVADSIVALVIMPIRISELVNNGRWVLSIDKCKYRATVSVYMCTVSIYHVVCMAIDRYLAICRPLMYHVMTVKAGYLMAGLSWGIPVLIYPLPVLSEWVRLTNTETGCVILSNTCGSSRIVLLSLLGAIASFYVPFSLMFLLYFRVLIQVRKFHRGDKKIVSDNQTRMHLSDITNARHNHIYKVEDEVMMDTSIDKQNPLPSTTNTKETSISSDINFTNIKSTKTQALQKSVPKRRTSKKALLTIGLIVVSFTICWLPHAIFMEISSSHADIDFPKWFETMTLWLGYLNSAFNPVLFYFHRGIRFSIQKLLFPYATSNRVG